MGTREYHDKKWEQENSSYRGRNEKKLWKVRGLMPSKSDWKCWGSRLSWRLQIGQKAIRTNGKSEQNVSEVMSVINTSQGGGNWNVGKKRRKKDKKWTRG